MSRLAKMWAPDSMASATAHADIGVRTGLLLAQRSVHAPLRLDFLYADGVKVMIELLQ